MKIDDKRENCSCKYDELLKTDVATGAAAAYWWPEYKNNFDLPDTNEQKRIFVVFLRKPPQVLLKSLHSYRSQEKETGL